MKTQDKFKSAAEAISVIKDEDRVFIHSVAMTPHKLIDAMVARAGELKNIEIVHIHTEGEIPYCDARYEGIFHTNAFFVGANMRRQMNEGYGDYVPVFLSDISFLFQRNVLPVDVALVQVSPPDKHGYCTLGPSVDVSLSAVKQARYVIAQCNPNVPRTHGDGVVHIDDIDALVEVEDPIHEVHMKPISPEEQKIGEFIAEMIEDGATLQMGIGSIPNAVLNALGNHKNIGIHTEMFSDGVIPLVEKGVINGSQKKLLPHKLTACFVMGSQKVYDFIDDNPIVAMKETSYTNDVSNIRLNPKVVAINSAIELDITGQVCADTIGSYHYSGVGGQVDFLRGAALSEGGKPIIAMQSVTRRGESKIVPFLKQGANVTTTRAHVHYVVTEYGVANLFGKNLRQRTKALIGIAHPDHREWLEREAFDRFKVFV